MSEWAKVTVSKWRSEGVKINSNASLDSIMAAETALNFQFPNDFKELYWEMDGFKDLDWQEHMFYFWPIERIIEEYTESSDKDFIGFCDFLLASHFIGFKKNQAGVFKLYSKKAEDNPIAGTFQEAVEMINSSSDLIY